jgi:hypothetical protein
LTFITSDHWCSSYGLDDVGGQHLDSLDDTFTTVSECGLDDVGGQLLESLDDTFAATVVAQPGEVKATARRVATVVAIQELPGLLAHRNHRM